MNISEVSVPEQHLIVTAIDTPMADLATVMGPLFEKVAGYAGQHQLSVSGPFLTRVVDFNPTAQRIKLEVGLPLSAAVDGHSGDVYYRHVPALKALRGDMLGHYSGLSDAHQAMKNALAARNLTQNEVCWEQYMTDPATEPNPDNWLTQLYYPVG